MNLGTWSLDTDSKRWLAVLAAVCVVSIVVLARAFMSILSPMEGNIVTVQKPATAAPNEAQTHSEPTWNSPRQITASAATESGEAVDRVSPFGGKNKLMTKKDEQLAQQELVHRQADYLRKLIATGKLSAGYGNLTKDQVDEMEKNGETIQ